MVIGRQAMGNDHHRATVIGHLPATAAIARLPAMASARHPAETIALPAAVETGHRQEAVIVHRRMAADRLAATEIAHRRMAIVRRARTPSQQVNKSQDERRDFRGVRYSPHGHQPHPVRA